MVEGKKSVSEIPTRLNNSVIYDITDQDLRYKKRKKFGWNRNTFDFKYGECEVSTISRWSCLLSIKTTGLFIKRHNKFKNNNNKRQVAE